MDKGHWTAPPGVKIYRKLPKLMFGRLDEVSENLERQRETGGQRTLDNRDNHALKWDPGGRRTAFEMFCKIFDCLAFPSWTLDFIKYLLKAIFHMGRPVLLHGVLP